MEDAVQTEVMMFVHHFPTHTIVWEVHETDGYTSLADTPVAARELFFVGQRDGKIYMGTEPMMMRRSKAEAYCRVQDNDWQRFTVIEIN